MADNGGGMHYESTPPDLRRDRRDGALLFLGAALLYLGTLCPTVYLGDSGEIVTAIAVGGVVHPPGYPLFSLLGRLSLWLVPFGEPALRIGCLVALLAAGAVALTYAIARQIGAGRAAAAAGAAFIGLAYSFWSQSVRVEVYSLHALLAAGAVLYALRYRQSGTRRDLTLAALALGLGIAHHLTIVLLLPGLLVIAGRRLWSDPGLPARLGAGFGVALIGPALYLLLPFWASRQDLECWGRPRTAELLLDHASARIFRQNLRVPATGRELSEALGRAGDVVGDAFPYLTLLLPLAGACLLWRKNRAAAGGLLLAGGTIALYNLCYQIRDIAGYFLPVWVVAGALLALALDALAKKASLPLLAGLILLVPAALQLSRNYPSCNLRGATFVREFARHKLAHCDEGAVLLSQSDNDTSPLLYVRHVLGVRPDVLLIDRTLVKGAFANYPFDPSQWYLYHLRALGVEAPVTPPRSLEHLAERAEDGYLLDLLTGPLKDRPLLLTFAETGYGADRDRKVLIRWLKEKRDVAPQGLLVRAYPRGQAPALPALLARNRGLWEATTLPELDRVRMDQEIDPTYIADHYATMLVNYGYLYELAGQKGKAAKVYQVACQYAPQNQAARKALEDLGRQVASDGQ